jgi:peptidoglycan hydrolase CwlO-like protein
VVEQRRRSSDVGWRKYVTVELTMSIIVAAFIAGGIWVNLNEDMTEAQSSINRHSIELLNLSVEVTGIESDIRLMAADSSRNKEVQEEIKGDLAVIDKDIKEILRVVHSR